MEAEGHATSEGICRHIDYIAQLVGPQHVALGIDFVIDDEQMQAFVRENKATMYPKGYPDPPWEYWPPEKLGELTEALLQRGYSDSDVLGILGENFLRVARRVWR
jgi:membrane dipeptidase